MANADNLWDVINSKWSNNESLSIKALVALAPIGTCNVNIPASYGYAILILLSNKRDFVVHEKPDKEKTISYAENAINKQANTINRNNYIWKDFLDSKVSKKTKSTSNNLSESNISTNIKTENKTELYPMINKEKPEKTKLLKEIIRNFRDEFSKRSIANDSIQKLTTKLADIGYKYDISTYPKLENTKNFNKDISSSPKTLAESLLWKLGKWKSYTNFVNYFDDNTSTPKNTDIVFFAFAKHLKNNSSPILDQHTLRAMWAIDINLKKSINSDLEKYLIITNTGKWRQSGTGSTSKNCYEYYKNFIKKFTDMDIELDIIDKFLMPLGQALKKQTKDIEQFKEVCSIDYPQE